MANLKDLNDAIAALPQKIVDSVVPLIPKPADPPPDNGVDTTVQIEALAQVPGQVASAVAAAIANLPAPVVVTNP